MIAGFLAIILVFFSVFAYTFYEMLAPQLIDTQLDMQTRYAKILCQQIAEWKRGSEVLSAQIAVDEALQEYLRQNPGDREAFRARASATLVQFAENSGIIQDIFLVDKSYNIIGTGDVRDVKAYVLDRISSAERALGGAAWDSGYDTNSMMLYRAVCDAKYDPNASIGYLYIRIDNDEIMSMFNQYRLYEGQRFSLKGQIDGFEVTEQGFFYNYYDDFAKLIHVEISMSPWYLRTWSSKSVALEAPNQMLKRISIIILAACLFTFGFCLLLAQQVTKPVKRMREAMRYYGKGDFSAKVEIRGSDELAELSQGMNDMSEQISDLFDRIKTEESQTRKLELQTLVYQINPHFLYNTLDSINAIARQHDDREIAEIVTSLSRLFRLGLHQGEEFVTVRDELAHIQYYLVIQKVRFGNQLQWTIDVDDAILDLKICKFILQPIVENAIYYGVKSREEGGRIHIVGKRSGDDLSFTVEDFGEGMLPEELEGVRLRISVKTIPEGQTSGFGLWNVNQRLKIYYGRDSGVHIVSVPGQGTKVTLRLKVKPSGN